VELLLNLLLAAMSIGLVLGIFEIGLRLAGYRAIYDMYSKPSIFWEHDPVLGWVQQPGAQAEYIGPRPWPVEFKTQVSINSLGLHGPELEPVPPGGHRILALGDSMVAAFEVPAEASFTSVLQDRLSASIDAPVQVVNAGVRGYGTDQSLLYYRERGRRLQPDFVIFFYSGNDLVDNTTLHEMRRPLGKPAFTLESDGSLVLVGSPVPRYPACSEYRLTPGFQVERVDNVLGGVLCRLQMSLFDHSALFSFLTQLVPWNDVVLGWLYYIGNPHLEFNKAARTTQDALGYEARLTRALVVQMAREAERDGAGFLVIGEKKQLDQLGRSQLEAEGIDVVSLEPIEGASQQEIRFHHDAHYNVIGHERLARFLEPLIKDRLGARDRAERSSP
jgi:hypothetical protein